MPVYFLWKIPELYLQEYLFNKINNLEIKNQGKGKKNESTPS